MADPYQQAAEIIAAGKRVAAFSGAGMSAESGIPTFRDPGGIWDQFDADEIGTASGLLETALRNPETIRRFLAEALETFEQSHPNPGHLGLYELEKLGKLRTVITQNIDNLHRDAGNSYVIEVHGNVYRARCLACGRKQLVDKTLIHRKLRALLSAERFNLAGLAGLFPACSCGSPTRPDVVMFGESVQQLPEAYAEAGTCDVMLVLGTSGVVYPAAALPHQASQHGAKLIEINPTENCFHPITDLFIPEPTGKGIPKIVERLKQLLS